MRHFRVLLFLIVDFLLPDFRGLELFRGSAARAVLGFRGAVNLRLQRGVDFGTGFEQIAIGPDCYIAARCVFYTQSPATIKIGARVWIGRESIFWCGSHEVGTKEQRADEGVWNSIEVGDGSWVGLRCTLHASTGAGCILDSNTVLFKYLPDCTHAAGNPARPVKKIEV